MCKKFNSHDGFLRADQGRAKNCCQIGWIGCPILQVAQKATEISIFCIFLQSPHQVHTTHEKHCPMLVRLFFAYFNALETHSV